MSAVIRSADETRALSSRIHSLQLSNHLDDTHATLSATALQLCSVDRTRAVTLTHTFIIPDHTVNDRTWFRAMVTRTCSVQSALQHACRVLFLVHVQHVARAGEDVGHGPSGSRGAWCCSPAAIAYASWTCRTPNTSSGTRSLRSGLLAAASRSALPGAALSWVSLPTPGL